MQPRGLFISFEGGEGAGKSTQAAMLEASLKQAGQAVIRTREPGGSEGAELIRQLIVTGEAGRWSATTETLLLMAARSDHIERTIAPALAQGKIVICDRFFDSTLVYQGMAKGLGISWLHQLHALVFGNLAPDITFYLDIDPAAGLARTQNRAGTETRFEQMGLAFHQSLREGFLSLARAYPARFSTHDAAQPADTIHQHILATLAQRGNISTKHLQPAAKEAK